MNTQPDCVNVNNELSPFQRICQGLSVNNKLSPFQPGRPALTPPDSMCSKCVELSSDLYSYLDGMEARWPDWVEAALAPPAKRRVRGIRIKCLEAVKDMFWRGALRARGCDIEGGRSRRRGRGWRRRDPRGIALRAPAGTAPLTTTGLPPIR